MKPLGSNLALLSSPLALVLALGSLAACGDDIGGGNGNGRLDASVADDAAAIDAPSADAPPGETPAIASVDYPVIAHRAQLVITGSNLADTTSVTIGGVVHDTLTDVTADSITVPSVDALVALGTQPVVAVSDDGMTDPFDVTVIRLLIAEIDPDTPGADAAEFIELDTGLAEAVSLDGYVVALFNGNTANGDTLDVLDLDADTAATGLMLIGPATLVVAPQVVFNGPIQAGEDGAAIYQFAGAVGTFPADFAAAGQAGLLDAIIWESNDDADSPALATLITDGVVIDEGATSAEREAVSIARCPDNTTPRVGAAYTLVVPTPGVANAACP